MPDRSAEIVGARIAKRRHQLDWSQVELARRLGVSPSTVANWERGASYPKRKLGKVEQVLGVTLDGPEPEPEPEWLRGLHELIADTLPPHRAAKVKAAVDAVAFEDEDEPKRRRAGGG